MTSSKTYSGVFFGTPSSSMRCYDRLRTKSAPQCTARDRRLLFFRRLALSFQHIPGRPPVPVGIDMPGGYVCTIIRIAIVAMRLCFKRVGICEPVLSYDTLSAK